MQLTLTPIAIDSDPKVGPVLASPYADLIMDDTMSSFGTYLIGFIVLILGLGIAAYLLNVPTMWILVGGIILIGIGILMATTRGKMKDPPSV